MSIEQEYSEFRKMYSKKEKECQELRSLLRWVQRFLLLEPGYSREEISEEIRERLQQIDEENA